MNREIKFRAWQSQEKKMYIQGDAADENRCVFWKIWENKSHISEPMQYTGLKDKNSKDIYENDIIIAANGKKYQILFGDWKFRDDDGIYSGTGFYFSDGEPFSADTDGLQYEIIGNIYQNPNLLKEIN